MSSIIHVLVVELRVLHVAISMLVVSSRRTAPATEYWLQQPLATVHI